MNRVILVGRITRDPELRTSPNNVSFTAFSIAVNRTAVSSNGEREADFINCVAFNFAYCLHACFVGMRAIGRT